MASTLKALFLAAAVIVSIGSTAMATHFQIQDLMSSFTEAQNVRSQSVSVQQQQINTTRR